MKVYSCEQSDYDSHTVQILYKNKSDADRWLVNANILMAFSKKLFDFWSECHDYYIHNTNEEVWHNPDSDNMYAIWWRQISQKIHDLMNEVDPLYEVNHVDDFYHNGGSFISEREVF